MKEGLAESNPVIASNRQAVAASRDRVLNDAELAAVWNAAADVGQFGDILRLLALTGCRREEIGGLRWTEVDLDRALISLPGERTKNGRAFDIPLAPAALAILQAQPRREGVDFIFGRKTTSGFAGWPAGKVTLDRRLELAPWRLHDLRRTFATRLHERLLIPAEIVESLLNHTVGGVRGVYDRSKHLESRRRALARWLIACSRSSRARGARLRTTSWRSSI